MNLEIHKPELAQRVQAQIQSGDFHDMDELLEKALDALEQLAAAALRQRGRGGDRSRPLDALEQIAAAALPTATGAVVLAALQSSPCRDIDLTPPRVRLTNMRDVML